MNTRAAEIKGAIATDSTPFASAVLFMALALSLPALITYVELSREKQALFQASVQKRAFMSACVENFKTAYCETIWRTAENLPRRKQDY
jgi:hypothetical protein